MTSSFAASQLSSATGPISENSVMTSKTTDGDFVTSSWADLPVYPDGSFGPLLGMPEFVWRPRPTPREGLAYLVPKDPEGNMDVAVALREGDLDAVEKDEEWIGYAEFIR